MTAPTPLSQHDLKRLQSLARVLDDWVRIPGTTIRFGADAVIGLIPGIGDAAGALIGGWIVWQAHRMGTPGKLKLKMTRNVLLDVIIGLVPVLGDVSDLFVRANKRNIDLLSEHFAEALSPPEPAAQQAVARKALLAVAATGLVAAGLFWFLTR